ncbi:MAG: metallophosphoesterase family protein [Planctomycetales bacterium]
MRLGLITDIHEHVGHLRSALARLADLGVDRIVMLGDVFETGGRIEETCRLLGDAGVIGVWGNHDFGLCVDVSAEIRTRYPSVVLQYMASLQPRLVIGDCLFTHVEPWLDPENLVDLWYFDGPPGDQESRERIFGAAPHRFLFSGHMHRWLLATPEVICPWKGEGPIRFDRGRYFIAVGALCDGRYATFDTQSLELCPFQEQTTGAG